jgi:hypothetical protein
LVLRAKTRFHAFPISVSRKNGEVLCVPSELFLFELSSNLHMLKNVRHPMV